MITCLAQNGGLPHLARDKARLKGTSTSAYYYSQSYYKGWAGVQCFMQHMFIV